MATCPCHSKWCTSNDERVLQDNVLPCITRVATRIMWWQHVQLPCPRFGCYKVQPLLHHITNVATRPMWQHQEVVATCVIAMPKIWLLQGASSIASRNKCGNKTCVATPSGGNMCNCHHVRILIAIRCTLYCIT
jgi:hypothetical protein